MNRVTAIISALVICIVVCLSWGVNHYRDNAIAYKEQRDKNARELKLANAAITDIRQVETTARYLGTGLYWILVLIRTRLRLAHMDTPSPLTLLVTRKTPSKTSHLTIL